MSNVLHVSFTVRKLQRSINKLKNYPGLPKMVNNTTINKLASSGWKVTLLLSVNLRFIHIGDISHNNTFLSVDSNKMLVHAFVTCRSNNCNSLLYGLQDFNYKLCESESVTHEGLKARNVSLRIFYGG